MAQGKTTFIYALSDPLTGEVRYVGKSNVPAQRLLAHLRSAGRGGRNHRDLWIAEVAAGGDLPVMATIEEIEVGDWSERERYWIAFYRAAGDRLTNMTDGGDFPGRHSWLGKQHSEATRAKMRAAAQGRKHTAASRAKMSATHLSNGYVQSAEQRAKNSAANRGRKRSDETRTKMSAAQRGRLHGPMSDEHKAKIGAGNRGKKHSPEWVAKQREATRGIPKGQWDPDDPRRAALRIRMRGVPKTPEHRAQMAESSRAAHAARTHCRRNHEYTIENTLRYTSARGHAIRECRECRRITRGTSAS